MYYDKASQILLSSDVHLMNQHGISVLVNMRKALSTGQGFLWKNKSTEISHTE